MKKYVTSRTITIALIVCAVIMAWTAATTVLYGASDDIVKSPYRGLPNSLTVSGENYAIWTSAPVWIYNSPRVGQWQTTCNNAENQLSFIKNMLIAKNPAWTNWNEQIMTPGWRWKGNPIVTSSDNGPIAGTISAKFNTNAFVEFDFIPLVNSGVTLSIAKPLLLTLGGQSPGTVVIDQSPTGPEPGTLAPSHSGEATLVAISWIR
jgi:hypothetical protein